VKVSRAVAIDPVGLKPVGGRVGEMVGRAVGDACPGVGEAGFAVGDLSNAVGDPCAMAEGAGVAWPPLPEETR
jgi:hypothetical protein